jgi:predicted dehydrogenase
MGKDKVNVAIVGLGFGAQFIPIYKRHPLTNMYAICRRSKAALDAVGNAFAVERRYERFEDVLADRQVDFVHINSPLADHGWMTIAALKAGKHLCAPCRWPSQSTSAVRLSRSCARQGSNT